MQSLKKFAQFEIEAVICYHDGLFRGDVNRWLSELQVSELVQFKPNWM